MNVIILAAGYGERLYPLTVNCPKPLLHIGDRPIIDFILERIKTLQDLEHIYIVCNGLFFDQFQTWLPTSPMSSMITLINDHTHSSHEKLGTICDIQLVLDTVNIDSDILVIAGDNFFEDDLSGMISMARKDFPKNRVIGVSRLEDESFLQRYGVVCTDAHGVVASVVEKSANPPSNLVATCIYYWTKEDIPLVKQYIQDGENLDAPGYFMDWLAQRKKTLCYHLNGKWCDIGSRDVYESIQKDFL